MTVATLINGRWTLKLPEPRAARAEWVTGWERERLDAMHATIRPDDQVWDIGAEEGDLSCLYALWGAHVTCFEPSPMAWPWIRITFEANGYKPWACFRGFASDRTTEDAVVEAFWPECSYVPNPRADHGFLSIAGEPDNPHMRLDDWPGSPPNVITMDVEGGELLVLRGAEQVLRKHRPTVFVSVHPEFMWQSYGQSAYDVLGYMMDLRYRPEFLARDHEDHWVFRP